MSADARFLAALCLILTAAPAALAQGLDLRSSNQVPGLIDQNPDHVAITNIGSSGINLSYLDGAWKPVQVAAGESVVLKGQGNSLRVAFNDGAETKSVTLNGGVHYAIHWNTGTNRWAIDPYDEVARRPTGLRSR